MGEIAEMYIDAEMQGLDEPQWDTEDEVNTGTYWAFIEAYYPEYDSADEIALSGDFSLWAENERDYLPDSVENCIKNEVSIFEKALRNYIKQKKGYKK